MVAHVGYQHSSYEGGLSEKDAHSSGYVEKLFNFTTYKVPELKKSPLVHEESHQFRQLLKASKDCTCCLSRSAGLMYVFNYSRMFFFISNSSRQYLLRGWPIQQESISSVVKKPRRSGMV